MSSSVLDRRKVAVVRGAVVLSLMILGCGLPLSGCPGSKGKDCTIGTERCACTSASTCDPGLSCQNGSCVGPNTPPGTPGVAPGGPTGESLELEPFRAEGFAFAKPRGFAGKGAGPGTYLFEPASGSQGEIGRFQMTYLGRMGNSQAPDAGDLIFKAFADRKLTLVGKIDYGASYAAAVADTGKAGPERYVAIMYVRLWDLRNEDLYNATALKLRPQPSLVDVFTAEFVISDPAVMERNNLWFVLKSIAWGISIPSDALSRNEVAGSWEAFLGGLPLQYEDERGNWIGGQNEGSAFKLILDPEGNYQLSTAFSVYCTAGTICAVEGVVKANARGRFQLDAGVLTLNRSGCELRIYDKNLKLTSTGGCPADRVPVTLRMGRGEGGVARFSGLGSDVINADDQRIWNAGRKPAGSWNVTDADRAAPPAPPNAGGIAICGPVGEKEPNERQASPYGPFGQEMAGCFPVIGDLDYYEITAPKSDPWGGYIELTMANPTHGLDVDFALPAGVVVHPSLRTAPGPLVARWSTVPGQSFFVTVRSGPRPESGPGWSRYTMQAVYHEVRDEHEPNESAAEAKPIALGAPVQGFFFDRRGEPVDINDSDWYAVDLKVGPVSIKLDEVASNIHAFMVMQDPDGRRPPDTLGFIAPGVESSVTTPSLSASARVNSPGIHTLQVKSYNVVERNGGIPESWKKPYRLVVTQP